MPTRIAMLLAALFLALPAAALAQDDKPGPGVDRESAEEALETAEDAFRGRGVKTGRELSPALLELARGLPKLGRADRREARSLLARPSDNAADPLGGGWTAPEGHEQAHCTVHFCIRWVVSTADAPDLTDTGGAAGVPDYVETMAAEFETSYTVENGTLGWAAPKNDGDGKTDVYLSDIGADGIFGYAAPDPQPFSNSLYGYVVMDDDYSFAEFGYLDPLDPLRVTAAHEYNHVLQYTYDAIQDVWMFESTAVWAEERVYDAIDDYVNYLDTWAGCTAVPLASAADGSCSLKIYGSGIWNIWLDERYGPDVVRNAWGGSLSTNPQSFAPGAYDQAIAAGGGAGFADEFARFSAAMAEWRVPGSGLSEGALFTHDVDRFSTIADEQSLVTQLDHTTFTLVNIAVPAGNPASLRVNASFPEGRPGAIAVVGRTGSSPTAGSVTTLLEHIPNGGTNGVTLANPGTYGRITAVLVNTSSAQSGWDGDAQDWAWSHDDQETSIAVSTTGNPQPPLVGPPDTTITSGPPATTNSTQATFAFSATRPGTFRCSIDGGPEFSCSSTYTDPVVGIGRHTLGVRAIHPFGGADPTPASYTWTVEATPQADRTAPVIGQLAMAPTRFKAARRGASIAARTGTSIVYSLSENATMSFEVVRTLRGRRVGRACKAVSRANRRKRRCNRSKAIPGGFEHGGRAGMNDARFTGRVGGKRLKAGRYRLKLFARDAAGNRSAGRTISFKVVK